VKNEYADNIYNVRAVEDAIRATKRYTVALSTSRRPEKIQGNGFPSKVFCIHYEVYPYADISWDMPVGVALEWLTQYNPSVEVRFRYEYPVNKATISIFGGDGSVRMLNRSIHGFEKALSVVIENENTANKSK